MKTCNLLKHSHTHVSLTLILQNFLNGIIHLLFLGLHVHYQNDGKQKLVSQQDRAWSDCMDEQAGLALQWWQRLIIFGSIRDNMFMNQFIPQKCLPFTTSIVPGQPSYLWCQPGSILLADQLQILILISPKLIMDSSKNGRLTCLFLRNSAGYG